MYLLIFVWGYAWVHSQEDVKYFWLKKWLWQFILFVYSFLLFVICQWQCILNLATSDTAVLNCNKHKSTWSHICHHSLRLDTWYCRSGYMLVKNWTLKLHNILFQKLPFWNRLLSWKWLVLGRKIPMRFSVIYISVICTQDVTWTAVIVRI